MPAAEIQVTLPDGSEKRLAAGSTGADLAKAIGPGLAKAALAVRVDGQVLDLTRPLPGDMGSGRVAILTDKDPQALDDAGHRRRAGETGEAEVQQRDVEPVSRPQRLGDRL